MKHHIQPGIRSVCKNALPIQTDLPITFAFATRVASLRVASGRVR